MNQQDLEELLRQIAPNHDPGRLDPSEATETVEVEEPGPYAGTEPVKTKKPVRVLTWIDRGTGMTLSVQANADGSYTKRSQGVEPKNQGAPATTPAQQQADETGVPIETHEGHDQQGNVTKTTIYRRPDGTTYPRTDTVTQDPKPATRREVPVQIGGKNLIQVDEEDPTTHKSRRFHVDPATGQEVLPPTPATKPIVYETPAGKVLQPTNEQGMPEGPPVLLPGTGTPPQLRTNPQTGRLEQVNIDKDGNFVVKEVSSQTTLKPADIPVLQTKYGQVASSLGQLAQDLNAKAARGEITPQERDAAFKAAHEQATVAVDEMNTILGNSKAVWDNEIQQRGQTFTEAANRRSYAGSIMNNAVSTGQHIAESAGPGHGKATALGVMTLMDMGQKYAQGMGGFPSMDPVAAPKALQQAASVGLPGFGDNTPPPSMTSDAGAGAPAAPPPGGQAAPSNPFGAAVGNATATTRGLIESALHPPGAAQRPALGPPPQIPGQSPVATPLGLAPPGGTPPVQTLPQASGTPSLSLLGQGMGMGASGSPIGVPAFMGGGGAFDHRREGEAMLGASMTGGYGGPGVADPAWEAAVRRAMAMFG